MVKPGGSGIAKLSSMVKPGGSLLFYSLVRQPEEEESYYSVGSHCFYSLNISYDVIVSSIEEAGLNMLSEDHLEMSEDLAISNCIKFIFVCAEKLI